MNLQQLQQFRVIAQVGSISTAAQALFISQPALSQSLKKMEAELGCELFIRSSGKPLALSTQGELFLHFCTQALDAYADLLLNLTQLHESDHYRTLKLGITSFLVAQAPVFDFQRVYPQIAIQQATINIDSMEQLLLEGALDFAISTIRPEGKSLGCSYLLSQEFILLVSKQHRLAGKTAVSIHELTGEPFLLKERGSAFRETTDQFFRAQGFSPTIAHEYVGLQLWELVARGFGIGLGVQTAVFYVPEEQEKLVHTLHLTDPGNFRTVWLVWNRERKFSDAAAKFKEFIEGYTFQGIGYKIDPCILKQGPSLL